MVVNVTAEQAAQLIEKGELEVIDVRSPHEWADGHVPGARLIALADIRSNPGAALPRDGVLFVCAGGVRSQTAAREAAAFGLQKIYNLLGGTNAWRNAGLPIVNELSVAV